MCQSTWLHIKLATSRFAWPQPAALSRNSLSSRQPSHTIINMTEVPLFHVAHITSRYNDICLLLCQSSPPPLNYLQ